MALAIALSSSWNSSTTPLPDNPVIVVAEPTATLFVEPTAVPAPTAQQLQPTETVSSTIPCTPAGIVAAHWPMLPADVQEAMYTKPLILNKNVYNSPVIELGVNTLNSLSSNAAQSITFAEIQTNCGAPQLVRSNPLAYYSDDGTQTTALCVAPGCDIIAPEYRAVFVKNDIAEADTRELFSAFDLLFHFFYNRPTPLVVKQIGFLGDAITGVDSLQTMVLPFVQTRILTTRAGIPLWENSLNETESKRVAIAPGDPMYIDAVGITTAPSEQTLVQFFRTITIPNLRWDDGTPVSASDYVNGFENNVNAVNGLITDVEPSGDKRIIIRYIPGLPKELADALAPAALHDADILTESMGEWRVSRDGNSYNLTHSDPRKSFSISNQRSVQQMVDGLRMGTYDIAISDPSQTAALLATEGLKEFGYTIRLVPTGALWVLQK